MSECEGEVGAVVLKASLLTGVLTVVHQMPRLHLRVIELTLPRRNIRPSLVLRSIPMQICYSALWPDTQYFKMVFLREGGKDALSLLLEKDRYSNATANVGPTRALSMLTARD